MICLCIVAIRSNERACSCWVRNIEDIEDSVIRKLFNCCETLLGITPGGTGKFGGGPDDFTKVRRSMARNYGSKVECRTRSYHNSTQN